MKLNEVTLYENKSHRILKEGWYDLTESQKNIQLRFEKELFPLLEEYSKLAEATLTKDQVINLFKGAEETAMASGDNTSVAGKLGKGALAAAILPVDIAKKVDAKIKDGKVTGAFAHPVTTDTHPYILMNYQGKPRDVMTLAHELGHGAVSYTHLTLPTSDLV